MNVGKLEARMLCRLLQRFKVVKVMPCHPYSASRIKHQRSRGLTVSMRQNLYEATRPPPHSVPVWFCFLNLKRWRVTYSSCPCSPFLDEDGQLELASVLPLV